MRSRHPGADRAAAPLDRAGFEVLCREISRRTGRQGEDYRRQHADRFWTTYRTAMQLLGPGSTFASVGAGGAYVEAALVASLGAHGVVFDLPEAIEADADHYSAVGLHPVAVDLTTTADLTEHGARAYDLVFSCEIVEHLPAPPCEHFRMLAPLVAPNGSLLVTTPNGGSIRRVLKTLLHQPVLPPAERTFGPVSYENEGVHRREYMAREIIAALDAAGMATRHVEYLHYGRATTADRIFFPIESAVPWFRDAMNVIATPKASNAPLCTPPTEKRRRSWRATSRPARTSAPSRSR